jgi:DNA-binding transcriptional ArsR family regulator
LLCLSRDEGLSVSQLLERVGGEQSALSHQLRLLKQARLVKSERVGRHIIYSLYDRHVSHVVSDTLAHVKEEF